MLIKVKSTRDVLSNPKLDLNNRIEKYKNFDKITKENNKISKENGWNWNHYYYWKNKNHKLDFKDKIEVIKTLIKE